MFRTLGDRDAGIKLMSILPPDSYRSGGYWQFPFLFWQFGGDVILMSHPCLFIEHKGEQNDS